MTPDPEAPADPPLSRVYVDAFDRLTERLLERLRSLRQDVDGDLSTVRAELATLRQSVDAVADRVQMRHLRSTVEEVNGEVIALRRAVLADRPWPEAPVRLDDDQVDEIVRAVADLVVERVVEELAHLRADVPDAAPGLAD